VNQSSVSVQLDVIIVGLCCHPCTQCTQISALEVLHIMCYINLLTYLPNRNRRRAWIMSVSEGWLVCCSSSSSEMK